MTTTADPLSAGLMVICLFVVSCWRASHSGLEKLLIIGFGVLRFDRSASFNRIKPCKVGGLGGSMLICF